MKKIIVKPKHSSGEESVFEQIITLPHPRTQIPVRYLIQKPQLLQIIKINDSYKKKSWFINNNIIKGRSLHLTYLIWIYLILDGSLYLATPFDLIFLTIPTSESLGKYLLMEDILEFFSEYHFPILISYLGPQIKKAIRSICQELKSTHPFFRFDEKLLLEVLISKAKKIASHLPKSIEFEAITKHFMENIEKKELENKSKEFKNIIQLARLKTAMQFINSYLPIKYENLLLQSEDFTPLSLYLHKLQTYRTTTIFIQNSNNFTTDYLKKRPNTIFEIENKKKKKLKGNNNEIRKKMNTEGINKIYSFFKTKTQNKN
ncbi:uncharacterized protein T551_02421 [Pneumocystis jirovecii RU7]|uniref:Ribonuclease H2 subunit B n=1 Tax=Pneumocystis jirovecii (strain RU7) TaxID=1408657 RepID=A0A0W4ZL93_PNEJ7|nr:uncharacterized protein T551_02421 [Pneumocystis jirovecii RU7]KTW29147.1 hypothetical protein T551_02421 [Pneumocystis jirovecii RU7]